MRNGRSNPTDDVHPYVLADMQVLAAAIDDLLNSGGRNRRRDVGFALLVFPVQKPIGERCHYITNITRADLFALMRDELDHFHESEVITHET